MKLELETVKGDMAYLKNNNNKIKQIGILELKNATIQGAISQSPTRKSDSISNSKFQTEIGDK